MSFPTPAPQPDASNPTPPAAPEAPAAPATEPAAGAAQQPETPAVHPAWDKALDAIPGPWQEPIRKQIAETEREHQRALEAARQAGVPDDWRALYAEAQQQGLSVQDLADAYMGQQQLYQAMLADPDQFLKDISDQIDAAVAAGQLTRKEGAQLKKDAAGAAAETEELLTPEQQQLRELQQWRQQQEQQNLTAQQEWEQQQIWEAATAEADTFIETVHAAFDNDPQLAGANAYTRQIAAQVANGYLDADQTGTLTYEAAVGQALQQLREQLGWQGAPAPQGQQQPGVNPAAAIGAGGAAPAAPGVPKFDLTTPEGREARDAWLTQAAMEYNASQH